MSNENQALPKFKPERPIYLSTENTGFKTKEQVIEAVYKLRELHWLCSYGENIRPFHMSFNDEKQFAEFKKDANSLGITLKSPVQKMEDFDDFDTPIIPAEPNETSQSPEGAIEVVTEATPKGKKK